MIFRSNVQSPDLSSYFAMRDPPIEKMGHDIPSDPDFLPDCGFFSHDEAAILYQVAKTSGVRHWLDIGSRTGWTAAHLAEAGCYVGAIDPEYKHEPFLQRFLENTKRWAGSIEFMAEPFQGVKLEPGFQGFVIDGDHNDPQPSLDAQKCVALSRGGEPSIIVLHDFYGKPVRDAVRWLIEDGLYKCRIYWTENGLAVCSRNMPSGWFPPYHHRDPRVWWQPHREGMADFDFGMVS